MKAWRGVFPAVTTKMGPRGAIDIEATAASVDRLIGSGVSGVVVLPMLGENASLNADERQSVIEEAKRAASGRAPVLSGLAEATLETAQAHAKDYERFGAEGLMVFPSLGYRTDERETVAWFGGVAAATGLPIMIYNNPIAYGVDVTPAILEMLSDVETIVCIKEETGDIRRVTDIFVKLLDRYSVFCGVDDLILESVALGATGWVSGMANAWTRECVALFDLCAAGRFDEARHLYRALTPAFHLDTHMKLVQYIKLAESLVHGSPEWCREPRLPLVGHERDAISDILRDTIAKLETIRKVGSVTALTT